jgi:hypothetical protein
MKVDGALVVVKVYMKLNDEVFDSCVYTFFSPLYNFVSFFFLIFQCNIFKYMVGSIGCSGETDSPVESSFSSEVSVSPTVSDVDKVEPKLSTGEECSSVTYIFGEAVFQDKLI